MRDCTDLVVKAQAGDREALAALVASVQDDVWHLLRSRLGHAADAEDAAQETLVQAVVSLPTLREPRAFAGWLFRIALDKAKRRPRAFAAEGASEPVAKSEADPVEREETRQAVRRAVKGLDETLRTTVELRYDHGLAYADIARAMDCPEGTVADRLHTAHDRLKRALAGAGVAITMALLESELSAATIDPAPPRLAGRLSRLAFEKRLTGGPAGGPRPRTVAVGLVFTAILAGVIAWKVGRGGGGEGGETAAAPGIAASGPDASPAGSSAPSAGGASTQPATDTSAVAAVVARIRVRVLDSATGEALPGADVAARWIEPGSIETSPVTGKTDSRGVWTSDLAAGRWAISASATGFLWSEVDCMHRRALATPVDDESTEDRREEIAAEFRVTATAGMESSLDLRLARGGKLCCRVVDGKGLPIEGVEVEFGTQTIKVHEAAFGFVMSGYLPRGIRTDAEGRFAADNLLAEGTLRVSLKRAGLVARELDLKLGDPAEQALTMVEAAPIDGTVLDAFDRPIAGVHFFFMPDAPSSDRRLDLLPVRTGELGTFAIEAGEAGAQILVAWAPGHGVALVDLSAPPSGRLTLRLPSADAKVRGRVTDPDGVPIAGAQVVLSTVGVKRPGGDIELAYAWQSGLWQSSDGVSAWGQIPMEAGAPSAVTSEDGRFELAGVPLGPGLVAGVRVVAENFEFEGCAIPESGDLAITLEPWK